MASRGARSVARYVVPRSIVDETAGLLRSLSAGRRESVVLWTGIDRGEEALVTRFIVPHQLASPYHFDVPLHERLKIVQQLASDGEKLLVQLHTHPREAFHSPVDDRLAIPRQTGALSIVVADFATKWDGDLRQASVNRHLGKGVWSELSSDAVSVLFEVR